MQNVVEVIIPRSRTGAARALYSPEAQALLAPLGDITIRRASRVETWEDLTEAARIWLVDGSIWGYAQALYHPNDIANVWWADMIPVGGPVLGPFNSRDEALEAEVGWLRDRDYPLPSDVRQQLLG